FDEEANLSVGQYVLSNMKDVVELFENSLYIKVLNIYIQRIVDQKHTDLQTFINHTDPKISKLAIDLSTSPYEMSDNWDDKGVGLQNQPVPEENYVKDAIHSLLRIKLQKIKKLIATNAEKIKNFDSEIQQEGESLEMLLKIHQQLKSLLNELATKYGTIVIA
ncbi:MAG: hypothetical protein KJP00_12635, partial [Bacteroidia bacterium]|nr:hypothetical protein [Bacteroidia bacterium]